MEILNKKIDGVAKSIEHLEQSLVQHEKKDEQFYGLLLGRLDIMEQRILQSKQDQVVMTQRDSLIEATAIDAQKKAKKAMLAAGKYSVVGMIGGFFAQLIHYIVSR